MSDPRKFKNDIVVEGNIQLPAETADRALIIDGSNEISASIVTTTELELLSGATVDLADLEQDVADLVTLSGVPANSTDLGTFTGSIIPDNSDNKEALQALESAIENLPDPMEYKGTWDASTNTPTLTDGTGNNGDVWYVNVAGTQFTPAISFEVGDKAVYNGATGKYEKWDTTESVSSVFGRTGAVTAQSGDYTTAQVTESGNLYFTDERAQDAIGSILTDSNTIDFTYNDAGNTITADAKTQMSITSDASGLKLVNDSSSPGNSYYYGTDASGVKGYQPLSALGSPGDIPQTSFSAADSVASPTNVTGFAFSNASVRAFTALVSVSIDGTSDLFEEFTLQGIQKSASWNMSVDSVGDNSGITFSITSAGQIQYTSGTVPGFVSNTMKFRAWVTNV